MSIIDDAARYLQQFSDYLQQLKIMEIRIMLEFFGDQYQNLVFAMLVFIIMQIAKFSMVLIITFLSVLIIYVAMTSIFSDSARNAVKRSSSSSYYTPDGYSMDEPFFPQTKPEAEQEKLAKTEPETEIETEPETVQQKNVESEGSEKPKSEDSKEKTEPKTEPTQEPEKEKKRGSKAKNNRNSAYGSVTSGSSSASQHSKADKEVQTDRSRLSKNARTSR